MEVKIQELSLDGFGIDGRGRKFLKAFPGDVVRKAVKAKGYFIALEVEGWEEPPRCKHFKECNACPWQVLSYKRQLEYKKELVEKYLGKEVEVVRSPKIWGYRNKMELIFLAGNLGYRRLGRWYEAFDLEECHIAMKRITKAALKLKENWKRLKIPSYDFKSRNGVLRYFLGKATRRELLVAVVATSKLTEEDFKALTAGIEADAFWLLINDGLSDVAAGSKKLFLGQKYIEEIYNGVKVFFGPLSFMQPNPWVAEKLYYLAGRLAGAGNTAVDLFAGSGPFALIIAENFKEVYAVEANEESIEALKLSAAENSIKVNAVRADARKINLGAIAPDLIVVDPPRAGLGRKLCRKISEADAKRIIYASCNPKTFKKDLEELEAQGYALEELYLLDMLPHTPRVELLGLLERGR